jgi:hypothetical protein
MRAYSAKLASRFPDSCQAVSEEDLVRASAELGLPRYIFSGMQQVCYGFGHAACMCCFDDTHSYALCRT